MTRRIDPATDLTPREWAVLDLVADGLTNAEIAGLLNVREGTVKQYLFHASSKLGTGDRLSTCLAAGLLVRPARDATDPGAGLVPFPEDRTPLAPRAGGTR